MSRRAKKIKIGIADDDDAVRKSICEALIVVKDFEVILQASNGQELLHLLQHSLPEIILLEIQMPVMGGIEAAEKIKEKFPTIKVVVFSKYVSESNIIDMYGHGVNSFIEKEEGISELIRGLRIVSHGGAYTTTSVSKIIQEILCTIKLQKPFWSTHKSSCELDFQSMLSISELKILELTGERLTIKEIANKLFLSPNTVNNKQAKIRKKLNLKGRGKLLDFAMSVLRSFKESGEDRK